MDEEKKWQQPNLSNLIERLTEARQLLEQAAALAAAREADKVRTMSELQRRNNREVQSGGRRRYR